MKRLFFVLVLLAYSASAAFAEEIPLEELGTGDPGRAALGELLQKGLTAYEAVKDYRATFQKQEKSGETLGPKETIFLKFEKPFKIFMRWMNTHKEGLQVLYERGRHGGKLAIHKPGLLLGLAPVVFLDQNSPWVREGSESYDIEDAGIGSFLEDFAKAAVKGARQNKLKASVWPDTPGGETAEATFAGSKEGDFFAYRVIVHFDAGTALPDRMELFDWNDRPMGVYAYEDLKLDLGPEDGEFQKLAMKKLYRLYQPPAPRTAPTNNFSGKSPRATPTAG